MKFLGREVRWRWKAPTVAQPVQAGGGWFPIVREPYAGAWQRNQEIRTDDIVAFTTVWACVTLIASDIAKLWINLVEKDANGIWRPTESPAFSPVLRKPNRYSTRIKFFEHWMLSKLLRGNTYALKERDARGVVSALYILDPSRVAVLVAPDGGVYYRVKADALAGIAADDLVIPAREIIHDVNVPLGHPLIGVSAVYACGLAAAQGLKIQKNSEQFFANWSQPGGLISHPEVISPEAADRVKNYWEGEFTGANAGRVAILGEGMTYTPLTINAHDAQLVEQLKWTGEAVCSAFHVPAWKVGLAPMPPYGNVQAGNIEYYAQALQNPIESLEASLDEGLELPRSPRELGVEFDLDALLRMDTATQMEIAVKGVTGAVFKPNEARARFELEPVPGGDACYLQVQNYSLEALARRDAEAPAQGGAGLPQPAEPEPADAESDGERAADEARGIVAFAKEMAA